MTISLPDPMKQFVDGQVAEGRYPSASEYVRELIRADEKSRAPAQLEILLLQGVKGKASALTAEEWSAIRKAAAAQVKARRQGG